MSTLTTAQAADLAGMSPAAFRREMSRERARGRDYRRPGPDARTPLWDEESVREWAGGHAAGSSRVPGARAGGGLAHQS